MRILISFLIVISLQTAVRAQTIRTSIEAEDIWGAWLVKGTSRAWIVDGIPERARLWDYENDKIIVSFKLKENVKNMNVMNDGSLTYISHNVRNEYINLKENGSQLIKRFKQNAPSYYIHPEGKFFFGSIFEGFVTYTINKSRIKGSKLNETITGYSSDFFETNSSVAIFRRAKDVIQKMDIDSEGELSVSRAFDQGHVLFNDKKNQFVIVSEGSYRKYALPNLEIQSSSKQTPKGFVSAIYDSSKEVLYCSEKGAIRVFDLKTESYVSTENIDVGELYFEDRIENVAVGFSDATHEFYIIDLL